MKTLIISFGRLNPPTVGHQAMIEHIGKVLAQTPNAVAKLYLSTTHDKQNNPLTPDEKLKIIKKLMPDAKGVEILADMKVKNIFMALEHFNGQFDDIIVVCGYDRRQEYQVKLNEWNGKTYKYNSIKVISDNSRVNVSGNEISGSIMRQAVLDDNFEMFKTGIIGNSLFKRKHEQFIIDTFELLKTRISAPKPKKTTKKTLKEQLQESITESILSKLLVDKAKKVISDNSRVNVSGNEISGSLMRQAVLDENFEMFKTGIIGNSLFKRKHEQFIIETFELLKTRISAPKPKKTTKKTLKETREKVFEPKRKEKEFFVDEANRAKKRFWLIYGDGDGKYNQYDRVS